MSRHGKEPTERGTLTSWRQQREGLVRTRKEIDRSIGTHSLKTAEGGTRQDTERNRPSQALTSWRRQREGFVRTRKEIDRARPTHFLETAVETTCQNTERNRSSQALTSWRRQREGFVRTRKEIDRARPTHFLETAEGGTCQDSERNRAIDGHSLAGDDRGRDWSGHGKKSIELGTLTTVTCWR